MQWHGRLGVPYQGSKNAIAKEIVSVLPSGDRFVDLFAGGCAMTHAAILARKYNTFLVNDLHGMGVQLFHDAVSGKYTDRWKHWVTREEFYEKRDSDPYISLCWSFGFNASVYLYSDETATHKLSLHPKKLNGEKIPSTAHIRQCRGVENLNKLTS